MLWLQWNPNQSGNIWGGTHIPLLWTFRILDAIDLLYIRFNVCRAIVFTVIWIILVPILVKPIFSVRNAFRCTILITVTWMMVDSSDSADILNISLSPREVLCRQSWYQKGSIWQFKWSQTIMLKEWAGCCYGFRSLRKGWKRRNLWIQNTRYSVSTTKQYNNDKTKWC